MNNFVILCGGSGTRLWPLSRNKMPKQFLSLTNDYSLFQNTLLRINKLNDDKKNIYIICNQEHENIVHEQIKTVNVDNTHNIHIICEPFGMDSAAAICICTLLIIKFVNAESITTVLPCDHVFDDTEFKKIYTDALKYAKNNILTFGIKPTYPETGYGYIKTDINNNTIEFTEKPNIEKAEEYIKTGMYFWNAGVFMYQNKNIIDCFNKYKPDLLSSCQQTILNSKFTNNVIYLDSPTFKKVEKISFDYAIMEPLCEDINKPIKAMTIYYNGLWCDIGSFSSLHDHLITNSDYKNNNTAYGKIVDIETSNCYLKNTDDSSLLVSIGVENMVVINTPDIVLVCNKSECQNIKKIVNKLEKNDEYKNLLKNIHGHDERPWGKYQVIYEDDTKKTKLITVYPNKRLSLQSHKYRSEHWVITNGTAKVQVGENILILNRNEYVYIPVGELHRIENIGTENLVFIETQIGSYLGEDDIQRYSDDYGRQ